MLFILCGMIAVTFLAVFKRTHFTKSLLSAAVTSMCYLSVAIFIVVTFIHALKKSLK